MVATATVTNLIPFDGPRGRTAPASPRVSEIISALSLALDLTEGQPMGHSINTCLIGMKIAASLGLTDRDFYDLYFALLLKDTGCSSNATRMQEVFGGDDLKAKREVKTQDWTRVTLDGLKYLGRNMKPGASNYRRVMAIGQMALQRERRAREFTAIRCERGAQIALRLGFSARTAQAIRNLDELWNGKGHPRGIRGTEIPMAARIMNLAQVMEVFAAAQGPAAAMEVIRERSGTWFDPEVVRATEPLEKDAALWKHLKDGTAREAIIALEPGDRHPADHATIDNICEAFAGVIDAKSTYNNQHSTRVTATAVAIGKKLGFDEKRLVRLRRAALLHDLGKLSIPNSTVDKNGALTQEDRDIVELHPHYTQLILETIPGFEEIAAIAGAHHEKLDASGYPRKLRDSELSMDARALVVADMFDALSSPRAHRPAMQRQAIFAVMSKEVPTKLDPFCFNALKSLT
jgi:HD-GYP domain-containing protein (c-di-GMP phosphodiesterase class II)